MTVRIPGYRVVLPRQSVRSAAILGAALVTGFATAQELPALRAGLWEVSRTVKASVDDAAPQTVQTTECANPGEGMTARQEMLKKIGCTLAPMTHSGNTYTFSAVCGENASETTRSVLTVENDSAYSIRIESNVSGTPPQELLRATRVGDCPP